MSYQRAEAVVLRLRKLHQQTLKLDESYQNVSTNPAQRSSSSSRIKKTASNGKHLQSQIQPTTKQDDLLKASKKTKKEFDIDSDLFSSDFRVETKQKPYQSKKKPISSTEVANQRPPFSNARKNLISTIEDTTKTSNQKQSISNARKNQFSNLDETNKQQTTKPPFSTGKVNYSAITNDAYLPSKQRQKLLNRDVKNPNNSLNIKKNELPKKQGQPVRRQSLSKKSEPSTKSEVTASLGNKNYASRRKISNEEDENNSIKQQLEAVKATKEVERNPKSSRFVNQRPNAKEVINDDIPLYDFKTRQTDTIQNIIINRSDRINEAYRKVPQPQTITIASNDEFMDPSDELIKQAAAFLRNRKKQEANSNLSVLQKSSPPAKKKPISRIQQENKPFSWGNTLKSINDDDSSDINSTKNNKKKNYSSIKANVSDYQNQVSYNNSIYKGDNSESDELNLFFTPIKDQSKGINNSTKISSYKNPNLKATLLDESDSASLDNYNPMTNEVYLSTESETEIASDSLHQASNEIQPKDQFVRIMRKKLDKVLNSDSTELSESSDIGRPEVSKSITISKGNNNHIYSDSINSDESEDMFNNQQKPQQFSVTKNPNSKFSSIKNYGKVSSSNLSRFAQNSTKISHQNAFSSEADDYLSSDSKSEEIFSITEKQKDNANIIKSRNYRFNRNQNQGKLTVEEIKKNYLDSSTDNSSTKSADYEEIPDLIISSKSPKKAIREFNIVKNQVLNDIQSSESSSPEVLKSYSKKNSLSSSNEDNPVQKNKYDPFDTMKYSSIVLSEFDSQENFKFEENSNTINDEDEEDEIPIVKNPPKPESQIKAIVNNRSQSSKQNYSYSDENNDDIIPETKKSLQPDLQTISKKSNSVNEPPQQKFSKIPDFEEDEIEDDDEIPAMKKPPQPESQISAISNININQNKNSKIQYNEEEDDDYNEIPEIKKPPQPEPRVLSSNTNLSNKNQNSQLKVSKIKNDEEEDDDDGNDYEIPVVKKPPQPEPQITSKTEAKSSLNKNIMNTQKISDIDNDNDKDSIPIPQFDILSNKKNSKEKINSEIELDSDDDDVDAENRNSKKKRSPLRVSPPIGITYFSKVNKNDKFQPLKFDDNNELKENDLDSDKEQKFDDVENDEKNKIDQNNEDHSFNENDGNEEFLDDSFDEKLKMARNTISKIKGNQQKDQKSYNLFGRNLLDVEEEEEEKMENNILIEEEEEEKLEKENPQKEENQIQQSSKDKKQFQINSDDDLIENQIKPSSNKEKSQIQIDNIDNIDDDNNFESSINKEKKQIQIDDIDNDNFKSNINKQKKQTQSDNNDDDIDNDNFKSNINKQKKQIQNEDNDDDIDNDNFKSNINKQKKQTQNDHNDDDIDNFDLNKFKSRYAKAANKENIQFKPDKKIVNSKRNNFQQTNHEVVGSDSEDDDNEQFKFNDINNNNNKNINNSFKLDNIGSDEESDKAGFNFGNANSDDHEEETRKEKKFEFKSNEHFENEEDNEDAKVENLFNKKSTTSNSIEEVKKPNLDVSNTNKIEIEKSEEEEADDDNIKNNDIIINPKIELEEDEEDPIDPYFLDNNISDDSADLNENHDIKEETMKKFTNLNENNPVKKENQEEDEDNGINDFENLKRNFLNQEYKLDEEEEEEENIIANLNNNTNKEQNINPSNLRKEQIHDIINEEEELSRNEIDVNNDEEDEDDEEEDKILQRLKDFYSKNKVASTSKDSDDTKVKSNNPKAEDKPNSSKNSLFNLLGIEENEEEDDEGFIITEKTSNLSHLPKKMEILQDEEEDEEEENEINNIIKTPATEYNQNLEQVNKSGDLSSQEDKNNRTFNDSSALDFLKQEDFLEDRLFLSKNKAKGSNQSNSNEEEDINNDTQHNIPEKDPKEDISMQLIKKVNSILIEEEEEEEKIERKISKQLNNATKSSEEIKIIANNRIQIKNAEEEEEEEEINSNSLSKNNELKSNVVVARPQINNNENVKILIQKQNEINPTLLNNTNKNQNVEYEYEYEEEEVLEQITITNDETLNKPITNKPPIENKEETNQNQILNQEEKESSKNLQNEIDEANFKQPIINKNDQNVEYEYEYEEELVEQPQKLPIETNPKLSVIQHIETEPDFSINQPKIGIKHEENSLPQKGDEANSKTPENKVQIQNVEYEYEYEEELIEQPQNLTNEINSKFTSNLHQIDKQDVVKANDDKNQIEEEEDSDEAMIQRLTNFKGLDFDENIKSKKDLIDDEINDKKMSDIKFNLLIEEEEEDDISDDSLIKRLDQGMSLMGKELDDENSDENELDDVDDEVIQKKFQDFVNMPISDDDDDKDDNSL